MVAIHPVAVDPPAAGGRHQEHHPAVAVTVLLPEHRLVDTARPVADLLPERLPAGGDLRQVRPLVVRLPATVRPAVLRLVRLPATVHPAVLRLVLLPATVHPAVLRLGVVLRPEVMAHLAGRPVAVTAVLLVATVRPAARRAAVMVVLPATAVLLAALRPAATARRVAVHPDGEAPAVSRRRPVGFRRRCPAAGHLPKQWRSVGEQ